MPCRRNDLARVPSDLIREPLVAESPSLTAREDITSLTFLVNVSRQNATLLNVTRAEKKSSRMSTNSLTTESRKRTASGLGGIADNKLLFRNMSRNLSNVNSDPLHMTHSWTKAVYSHIMHDDNGDVRVGTYVENFSTCNGGFKGYSNEFALLRYMTIDRNYCHSERKGGEFIDEVIGQSEKVEFLKFAQGCFCLLCHSSSSIGSEYIFKRRNHLNDYFRSLKLTQFVHDSAMKVETFTIAITRYEYANLYHTMTDWYNAFLVMHFFNKTSTQTDVLLMDAHPRGLLDQVWATLFRRAMRISDLNNVTHFNEIAWSIQGYNSPLLSHNLVRNPLITEFRDFVLSSYGLSSEGRPLDCLHLRILFIWRHDYVAHPRKPSGEVNRKIANEEELLEGTQSKYPNFTIQGVQIDTFEMRQQLQMILDTDILIGMHGAGLTHALFLPPQAGLIELYPTYWSPSNQHFKAIARWRGLHYAQHQNTFPDLEKQNGMTIIPTQVVGDLLDKLLSEMCITA